MNKKDYLKNYFLKEYTTQYRYCGKSSNNILEEIQFYFQAKQENEHETNFLFLVMFMVFGGFSIGIVGFYLTIIFQFSETISNIIDFLFSNIIIGVMIASCLAYLYLTFIVRPKSLKKIKKDKKKYLSILNSTFNQNKYNEDILNDAVRKVSNRIRIAKLDYSKVDSDKMIKEIKKTYKELYKKADVVETKNENVARFC